MCHRMIVAVVVVVVARHGGGGLLMGHSSSSSSNEAPVFVVGTLDDIMYVGCGLVVVKGGIILI